MDDKKENFRKFIISLIVYVCVLILSLLLLMTKFIDGASFVAANAIGVFCVFLYKLSPKVSEFSIAGNSVKLKQTLDESLEIKAQRTG
ncbi:hypothetical protein [Pantoea sp. B65]|uniref:hypothetical protein n=1 Tax=Pantoea sp. B65 TaxID=2813359 RepID=UPI0039B490C3